jgi:hypothetical protein
MDPGLHQLAHFIEQLVAIVLALLINPFHVAFKLLAVFHVRSFAVRMTTGMSCHSLFFRNS